MISGRVNSNLESVVRFRILDGDGQSQAIDGIIDTGFSEFLSIPIAMAAALGLPWNYHDHTRLIDGRLIRVDIFSATVIWNGKPRNIKVQALGNHVLIGVRLLAGHDLAIRVTDGGPVTIEAIP